MKVGILIGRSSGTIEVDVKEVELHVGNPVVVLHPISSEIKDASPYFHKSIGLTFASSAGEQADISVVARPGFIKLNGVSLQLAPFRFHKVQKLDVYYGSINC